VPIVTVGLIKETPMTVVAAKEKAIFEKFLESLNRQIALSHQILEQPKRIGMKTN
jgi:hypothetical protein